MSVYLTLGKNAHGDLIHITTQHSGLTELVCPFCDCSLIAVRGKQKAHHFRHNGDTCNESPQIEGWHHFYLNYPLELFQKLRKIYKPEGKNPLYASIGGDVYDHGLVIQNEWTQHFEFSEVRQIIIGHLSLIKFSHWMRKTLAMRYTAFKSDVVILLSVSRNSETSVSS